MSRSMPFAPLDRRRRPRQRGALAVSAVVAGGVALSALAGCGGHPAATIDAAKLNTQISTGLAHRLGIPGPPVHCPGGQANRPSTTFRCSSAIDGQSLTIAAAVSDSQGNVHWQPSDALISTPETAAAIDRQFGAQLHSSVTADCGRHPLAVVAIGASITCAARVNGSARQITVTARDLAGNVDLSLAPPATGPRSTTPPVTAAPTPGSLPGSRSTLPATDAARRLGPAVVREGALGGVDLHRIAEQIHASVASRLRRARPRRPAVRDSRQR